MTLTQTGAPGAAGVDAAHQPVLATDIAATPQAVRDLLQMVRDRMTARALTEEECWTLELALAEALNNIVEHAYADARSGVIGVALHSGERGIEVQIVDDGREMPGGAPPFGQAVDPETPIPDLPEGGFGWFLIREVAHDIGYRRIEGRNHLSFRVAVGPL
jgi:serine/threonine-protein kinase RsbW